MDGWMDGIGWSSGEIWGMRRSAAGHSERDGHRPVVATAGQLWQLCTRHRVLQAARLHLQLPPLRQPQARRQQAGPPPPQVRDQGNSIQLFNQLFNQ